MDPNWSTTELRDFFNAFMNYGTDWNQVAALIGNNKTARMVEELYADHKGVLDEAVRQVKSGIEVVIENGDESMSWEIPPKSSHRTLVDPPGKDFFMLWNVTRKKRSTRLNPATGAPASPVDPPHPPAVGLKNLGSTCFMNSILQVLNHIDSFAEPLMRVAGGDSSFVVLLANVITAMRNHNQEDITERLKALVDVLPATLPHYQLKDEFDVVECFDGFCEELQKWNESLVVSFTGLAATKILRGKRSRKSTQVPFHYLVLDSAGTIQGAIDKYYSDRTLLPQGKKGCQCQYVCQSLEAFPEILCLVLKRFIGLEKSTDSIDCEEYVSLTTDQGDVASYQIFAIICHLGKARNTGHYYAVIKRHDGWNKFDDDMVQPVGHHLSNEFLPLVYMGFYKRVTEIPEHTKISKRRARKLPTKDARNCNALREIRKYQMCTDLLIKKAPFERVVKEFVQKYKSDMLVQRQAVLALQEAVEDFLCHLFEETMLCAVHAKRVTIKREDMQLAKRLRGD